MLDSFQKIEYFERNKGQGSAGQQLYINDRRQLHHNDYINLYERLQNAEKELGLYGDIITLTQDFPPLATPENSFSFYFKKYIWWFLLLGFSVAIFWDNRKFLISNMLGKKNKT